MKVAVITYSDAQNYGAQLQAYALTHFVEQCGCDCNLIEYRNFDRRWFKPRKTISDIIATMFRFRQGKRRVKRFEQFRENYLKRTALCCDSQELSNLNACFDTFITGSDQVWNCNTRVNDDFFLRFVQKGKKKIAYAPSFGSASIPQECEDKVATYIKDFDFVSVRERSGAELIRNLTNKDVPVVFDPVFLLEVNTWKSMIPSVEQSDYIFVYTTQVSEKLERTVQRIQAEKKLKVISTQKISGCNCTVRKDIGPIEFLQMISGAKYVVSTSFHATAFSIILEKDFCVVPHSQTGARVTDLVAEVGLENTVVADVNQYDFQTIENWDTVKSVLQEKVNRSKQYLIQALKE